MKKLTIFIALVSLLLLSLSATAVYADGIPALPHAFYGSVTINGSPAAAGTRVSAKGPGVITGVEDNPTITTVSGIYGTSNPFEPRLIVQGSIEEGATITFYVNGVSTAQTAEWHSGQTTELPLSLIIEAPSPPLPTYVETTLFGVEGSFPISPGGEILQTIEATSEDEMVTITIEAGTIALDKYGNPLTTLTAAVDPSPPEPPEGSYLMGAYDFGPDGATFTPPITLTWSYDPDTLPEGVSEEDLVIGYYSEAIGDWVWVPCQINTETNTITASVSHFTTFAIIGTVTPVPAPPVPPAPAPAAFSLANLIVQPAEVNSGETVTISVSVANTGGESGSYNVALNINGVTEVGKGVTVAAGSTELVTFSVSKEDPGSYSVTVDSLSASFTVVAPPVPAPPVPPVPPTPPAKEVNWPLIGGIIGGIIAVGLFIFFVVRWRRAY